jgi:hypothetical protein
MLLIFISVIILSCWGIKNMKYKEVIISRISYRGSKSGKGWGRGEGWGRKGGEGHILVEINL